MEGVRRKDRVLIVDDEPGIRDALHRAIERMVEDVEVLTAASGEDALAMLRTQSVELVVSDQRMPGLGGVDLLAEVRRISPGARRVLMTAYPDIDLLTRATNEARLARFLAKPFRLEEVLAAVREELEGVRAARERDRALARSLNQVARLMTDRQD